MKGKETVGSKSYTTLVSLADSFRFLCIAYRLLPPAYWLLLTAFVPVAKSAVAGADCVMYHRLLRCG